ncbi:KAP family P-loop domain-containing protein, partial [Candidatus Methanophagaceae archaeon]
MVSKCSDVAVRLSEDRLGFRDYAEGVIATLESLSKDDTPFTIGIFGSWGSGKTSFMQIMQELLESRGYETIFLNSWEYGNEEKLWIPFMIKVVDKLFEDGVVKKDLIRNVALFSTDVVLQTGTQGRVSTGAISNLIARSRKNIVFKNWLDKDTKTVIERVTKIEKFKKRIKERAEGSYLFSIDTPVLEKLFSYSKLSIRAIAKRCRKVNFYHINKYKEDLNNDVIPKKLKREFKANERSRSDNALKEKDKWVIPYGDGIYIVEKEDDKIKIYEKSKKGKIIIFIDDLDRIPEEKIVNFLDSLKIFLDISGCIFVLGCDYEILKNALKNKYGEEEIYKDYFDKIVQAEFYIPKISEQAIKKYLQFLTGWDAKEIEECTQLVIHSIGGNPRKIKRVVNATMLIKSVFEKRLATFLQAFERPKPEKRIERMGEVKKEIGDLDVPSTSESKSIRIFIYPSEVFDFLFDKKMLFKLMCMREQWPAYYEDILSEEKKQKDLISFLQEERYIPIDIREYTGLFSTAKGRKELEENLKKLSDFLKDPPGFQGVDRRQKVVSLKTYLTFLNISSPEAGIALKWEKPEKLPINLFNRYMMFERINRGKVEEGIIEKKIKQMDWESDLKHYYFFIAAIRAFKWDNLLKDLFKKGEEQIANKIKASKDLFLIGRLLGSVWRVNKDMAKDLLKKIEETYAEKIKKSTDLLGIGVLLLYVREIDKKMAEDLLKKTEETYAEKIKRTGTDLHGIGVLLDSVWKIEEETARKLLKETEETYAEKIKRTGTDPHGIGVLLDSVWKINKARAEELLKETEKTYAEKIKAGKIKTGLDPLIASTLLLDTVRVIEEHTAKKLLNETSDTIAEKIRASSDLRAIGDLLFAVRKIEEETARKLLSQTKDTIAEKIIASSDPYSIGRLLFYLRKIEEETARKLLNVTSDTYAEKIIASSDLYSIERLLFAVRKIEEETARKLLNVTKDSIAEKIRASSDPGAIGRLLDQVRLIEEETARSILNRTKKTYADKIIASTDPGAIGRLLSSVREIEEETARVLLSRTKKTYAKKIIASTDPAAIGWLLGSVWLIEEETARSILNRTKDTYADKIIASTDLEAIGQLLESVSVIEKKTARGILNQTKDTYADKIIASSDLEAIGQLLESVSVIEKKTARVLLNKTKDMYADKIRASTDPKAIGQLLESAIKIDKETARVLLNQTKDSIADKIRASTDPRAIIGLLNSVSGIDKETARGILNQTKDSIADKIIASTNLGEIGWLLGRVREVKEETARGILNQTKDSIADKIIANTDLWAIGRLLGRVSGIDNEIARGILNQTKDTIAEKIIASSDPYS